MLYQEGISGIRAARVARGHERRGDPRNTGQRRRRAPRAFVLEVRQERRRLSVSPIAAWAILSSRRHREEAYRDHYGSEICWPGPPTEARQLKQDDRGEEVLQRSPMGDIDVARCLGHRASKRGRGLPRARELADEEEAAGSDESWRRGRFHRSLQRVGSPGLTRASQDDHQDPRSHRHRLPGLPASYVGSS